MNIIKRAEQLKSDGVSIEVAKTTLIKEFGLSNQLGNLLYKLWIRSEAAKQPITQEQVDAINHYFGLLDEAADHSN